ncbi:MAG: hypothetical protein JWP30_2137 [Homoserinimonas sp.]|nr:hypothetical protein [Homoserinimonas sp.]
MTAGFGAGKVQPAVRRLIVYSLLFALVIVGSAGFSGLLGRVLTVGEVLVGSDSAGLAQSLAFSLIAGPLAAILWLMLWRRLDDDDERSSLSWGLYCTGMYTVSLIVFSTALLQAATSLIAGEWQPRNFATGLVWAAVWLWHRWMRISGRGPVRMTDVPVALGVVFGLVIAVGGALSALTTLFDTAITLSSATALGAPWGRFALQSLTWAVGGAVIWWWHWLRQGGKDLPSRLSECALIVVGVLGMGTMAVAGLGTSVFVVLRLTFDRADPIADVVDPLAFAIAAAAVGSFAWTYHRAAARRHSGTTREADKLVTSGVGMVTAVTGVGVVINSTLAALATPLAGENSLTLLLAGVSAILVGVPVWWRAWKVTDRDFGGRRIYLIVVFGVSAVVALITLLVIAYRLFEFFIDEVTAVSLIERVRAPFGLIAATVLAAGYHYIVWRHDLPEPAKVALRPPRIRRVTLVIDDASRDTDYVQMVKHITGAQVQVWRRAQGARRANQATVDHPRLERAFEGVSAQHVLVIVGDEPVIQVIPLAP